MSGVLKWFCFGSQIFCWHHSDICKTVYCTKVNKWLLNTQLKYCMKLHFTTVLNLIFCLSKPIVVGTNNVYPHCIFNVAWVGQSMFPSAGLAWTKQCICAKKLSSVKSLIGCAVFTSFKMLHFIIYMWHFFPAVLTRSDY